MKLFSSLVICAIVCSAVTAQTYNGTGGPIPDNGITAANFTINVAGLSPSALSALHGLKTICINITHPYDSDLEITLKAPDGTEILLAQGVGGSGNNFTNTCFDQGAANSITAGNPPFTGSFRPMSNIGYANNLQNGNGTWTLRVFDNDPTQAGSLLNWSLTFGNSAPVASPFSRSNLPIVVINTGSQTIPDDPKITADMGIIYNGPNVINHLTDPKNNYNGKIGIELRGSSSQGFPKKSYGLETRDAAGNDIDVPLVNMPAQSDWILSASYSDKSLLNNVLAYKLYRDFGAYAPRTCFVELVLNNQYKGVYVLMEKIKRDSNRVDVSKLTTADTAGDALTGGYIIKIDKTTGSGGAGWNSAITPPVHPNNQQIFYQYEYPDENTIVTKQKNYIKKFVDSFENALNVLPLYDTVIGWRKFAAEKSFVRYFILNELSKNVDGYRLSTYLYKSKNTKGNKLRVGPPWDYDLGFHNADYCKGDEDTGWAFRFGVYSCSSDGHQIPFWWEKLMTDTSFQNSLKCMYSEMRTTVLDTVNLFHYIDSIAAKLDSAQMRNFETWPILGIYVWPNPSPIPTSYAGEIKEMKDFIKRRLLWLDAHIPGTCYKPLASVAGVQGILDGKVFPNPFTNEIYLEIFTAKKQSLDLRLLRIDGTTVAVKNMITHSGYNRLLVFENTNPLPPGIYMLQIKGEGLVNNFRLIKQ